MSLSRLCRRFLKSTDGATAVEYGLIAALIAVSVILGAESVGNGIGNLFLGTSNKLDDALD